MPTHRRGCARAGCRLHWFHKSANVLVRLPKSAHPGAIAALKEFNTAEDIDKAQPAVKVESTFASVQLRTKVTKGPPSRTAGITMAYNLIEPAQARWRKVNAPELVALVRNGALFHKGKLLERPRNITAPPPTDPPATTATEVA